jgi:hypothetical protein
MQFWLLFMCQKAGGISQRGILTKNLKCILKERRLENVDYGNVWFWENFRVFCGLSEIFGFGRKSVRGFLILGVILGKISQEFWRKFKRIFFGKF